MKLKIRYLHSKPKNMKKITSISKNCLHKQKNLKLLFSTQNQAKITQAAIQLQAEKCLLGNLTKQKGPPI
jgi:hypothetical protein